MSDNWAVNLAREESHYQQLSFSPPLVLPPLPGACCYSTLVPPAHCEYEYLQQSSHQLHRSNPDDGYVSCSNSLDTFSETSQEDSNQPATQPDNPCCYDWTSTSRREEQKQRKRKAKNEMERDRVYVRGLYINVLRKIIRQSPMVAVKPTKQRKLTQLEVLMYTRQIIESLKTSQS